MPIKTLPASILLSLLCAAPALQAWQATPEPTAADKACAEAKALIEAKRDLPKAIALLRPAAEPRPPRRQGPHRTTEGPRWNPLTQLQ